LFRKNNCFYQKDISKRNIALKSHFFDKLYLQEYFQTHRSPHSRRRRRLRVALIHFFRKRFANRKSIFNLFLFEKIAAQRLDLYTS